MVLPEGLTEDELTAQALAADPEAPLSPLAVPFRGEPTKGADLLPAWYMPAVVPRRATPGRRAVALAVVVAAVVINGLGLCITYGTLSAG